MKPYKTKCAQCGNTIIRVNKTINHYCNLKCKAIWQVLHNKPVTEEWLREKYLVEKMDCTQIAYIVKRDPKSVWFWLKQFGIPTRPRGGFTAPACFKKGQVSLFKGHHHTDKFKKEQREKSILDGRLPWGKNNPPYMKGRTGANHPTWKGGLTPERQAFYSTIEWKEACKKVWHRANAKCERCGIHHNTTKCRGTFDIHHIESFMVRESRAKIENLILLCEACHRFIHSRKNTNKELIK